MFDKEAFIEWQMNTAVVLSAIAACHRTYGSKDDYLTAMAFGAGAMVGMSVVRKALESGEVPSEMGMRELFGKELENHLAVSEVLAERYDKLEAIKED